MAEKNAGGGSVASLALRFARNEIARRTQGCEITRPLITAQGIAVRKSVARRRGHEGCGQNLQRMEQGLR